MDIGWLFAIPAALAGFSVGRITRPTAAPNSELPARVSDLERHVHHHAAPVAPASASPPHGPDYDAWGLDIKTGKHWRRHKNGTTEHSADGKF